MLCAPVLWAAKKNILETLLKVTVLKLKTEILVFGGTNLGFAVDLKEVGW